MLYPRAPMLGNHPWSYPTIAFGYLKYPDTMVGWFAQNFNCFKLATQTTKLGIFEPVGGKSTP